MSISKLRLELVEIKTEFKSRAELISEFYSANIVKKSEWNNPSLPFRRTAVRPIVFIYNPPGFKHSGQMDAGVIVAVYYKGYYVKIEEGKLMGPQAAKLMMQVRPGEHVWLGTAQIAGCLLDEKTMKIGLKQLIVDRKYFASSATLEQGIEISIDKPWFKV